jgi:hypothetical protein
MNRWTWFLCMVMQMVTVTMLHSSARKLFQTKAAKQSDLFCTVLTCRGWNISTSYCASRKTDSCLYIWCGRTYPRRCCRRSRCQYETVGSSFLCWSYDSLEDSPWTATVPLPFSVCALSHTCWSATTGELLSMVCSGNCHSIVCLTSALHRWGNFW